MFGLYFLWPFCPGLLRHRCCPNITIPLCRAGLLLMRNTHISGLRKRFVRQGITITFWWTSPNNQALLNLIPLKYNLKSEMCPEQPRKRTWCNWKVKCHAIKVDMWGATASRAVSKKTDNEKPCIITFKFSDETVKILSCFIFTPHHASFFILGGIVKK